MNDTIQTLTDFIEAAKRSRKYPDNTAYGFRAALRLFEPELTSEEKESLDTLKSHFEQIYQNVFNKNKSKYTASSLSVYRRRLLNLMADYEKYGIDPTKIASWNRPLRKISSRKPEDGGGLIGITTEGQGVASTQPNGRGPAMDRFELSLRPNVKAIILVPSDLSTEEVKKIRGLVDYLDKNARENNQDK